MRFVAICLAAWGCSENHAPSWTVGPQQVNQGETLVVPFTATDRDGDLLAASVESTPDGLEAGFAEEGSLVVHALYTLSGAQQVVVLIDDHKGGVTRIVVDVTVIPIGWQWSVTASDPGPTAREHGQFVVDTDRDLAYLLGGSGYAPQGDAALDAYWSFDLKARTWAVLAPAGEVPPPGASRRAAVLADQKLAYLFGGYQSNTTDDGDLYRFDYSLSPPRFTKLPQGKGPAARELHVFAYDPGSDTFVVFGGVSATDQGLFADTWTMKLSGDSATWTQLTGTGPGPRYGAFYALEPISGVLYVWSGARNPGLTDPINAAQDTWALDLRATPPAWSRVLDGTEPGSPKGRRNGAFIFEPVADASPSYSPRLLVFGGTADGATTVPGIEFLDLRPGKLAWASAAPDAGPPLRSSCFGFYDAGRAQLVVGFGNDRALYRDLSGLGY